MVSIVIIEYPSRFDNPVPVNDIWWLKHVETMAMAGYGKGDG